MFRCSHAQNSLLDTLALCILIAILSSIGLSISGLEYAILLSVLVVLLPLKGREKTREK